MEKNKVRFSVYGTEFCIVTNDSEEYISSVAAETEARLMKYLSGTNNVSAFQAAVLTAMEYADENKRKEGILDNIKTQLKSYLDDAARIKSERDRYKAEYEKLLAAQSAGNGNK